MKIPSWGTPRPTMIEHTVFGVYSDTMQRACHAGMAENADMAEQAARMEFGPQFVVAGVAIVEDGRIKPVDVDPFMQGA